MRFKRTMAAILAAAMVMSSAVSVFAADSSNPTAPTTTEDTNDPNKKDHEGNLVTSEVKNGKATVIDCTSDGTKDGDVVEFRIARDPETGKEVDVYYIGDGKKGVFDNKKNGSKVKTVNINSKAKKVIVRKYAFKKSKVKTIKVATNKLQISKNAFKGTKNKKIVLRFVKKKAKNLSLKKGAFNGIKKITVKGLKKKEFNKVKKALKKAGFKGTIKKG